MILRFKEGSVFVPDHWNYSKRGDDIILGFSSCRETCSGDLGGLYRTNAISLGKVPDTTVAIGDILGRRDKYTLNKHQERALQLLSYTLSELVNNQGAFNYTAGGSLFLRQLSEKWYGFNCDGRVTDIDESDIQVSMENIYDRHGTVYLPFSLLEYRALLSFLMAIPRAFSDIAANGWMYVGHAEPIYKKTSYVDKLWTNMYACLGNAFRLYSYTGRYWWTFLHMLIDNTQKSTANGLLEYMVEYSGCSGVRTFIHELESCGYLPKSSKYYFDELHNEGFFAPKRL